MKQFNDLRLIAVKCPFTDGIAVYHARALLANIDTVQYLNVCEIPDSIANNERIAYFSVQEDTDNHFYLYPNPANEEIIVEFESNRFEKGNLEIYNALGEKILSFSISNGEGATILPVTSLTNGIYLYQFRTPDALIQKGKLIISR